jgi:hypothetical protein
MSNKNAVMKVSKNVVSKWWNPVQSITIPCYGRKIITLSPRCQARVAALMDMVFMLWRPFHCTRQYKVPVKAHLSYSQFWTKCIEPPRIRIVLMLNI